MEVGFVEVWWDGTDLSVTALAEVYRIWDRRSPDENFQKRYEMKEYPRKVLAAADEDVPSRTCKLFARVVQTGRSAWCFDYVIVRQLDSVRVDLTR
jgi:hypothetical protein